jgi:glutamyl-Q tRNA(Asp) synthetase
MNYTGRFAPSPTGPLHAGSLVAALASWLDARAHGGRWLVRIEDVDTARCIAGADRIILQQLQDCGLLPDAPPLWQSQRSTQYQQALGQLIAHGLAYPCNCSRRDIENAMLARGQTLARHGELVYPGTCRPATPQRITVPSSAGHHAWRLRTDLLPPGIARPIRWHDRRLGAQQQDVEAAVGDFVLQRADGCFSYQLAVVVDDAAQGMTDVVRGEDLADNTARQILLQRALGLPTPRYLHTPLLLGLNGEKLSKQNGAQALDTSEPLVALNRTAAVLGLPEQTGGVARALEMWVRLWRFAGALYNPSP